jgi:hypothetical protein
MNDGGSLFQHTPVTTGVRVGAAKTATAKVGLVEMPRIVPKQKETRKQSSSIQSSNYSYAEWR